MPSKTNVLKSINQLEPLLRLAEKNMSKAPEEALNFIERALLLCDEFNLNNQKIECLFKKGSILWYMNAYSDVLDAYFKALELSILGKNKDAEARAILNIGNAYYGLGNYDIALDHYSKALKILLNLNNKKGIGRIFNNMGIIYSYRREYDKALAFHKKSLSIKEVLGDLKGIGKSFINLGNTHFFLEEYDLALDFHFKALSILEENGFDREIANAQVNIGTVYRQQGLLEQASDYFEKALGKHTELKNKSGIAHIHLNLGLVLKEKGFPQDALKQFEKGAKLWKEAKNNAKSIRCDIHICTLLLEMGKTQEIPAKLEETIQLAHKIGLYPELVLAIQTLSEVQAFEGDYKAAYATTLRLNNLKDEQFSQHKDKLISDIENQHQVDQRNKDIEILQALQIVSEKGYDTQIKQIALLNHVVQSCPIILNERFKIIQQLLKNQDIILANSFIDSIAKFQKDYDGLANKISHPIQAEIAYLNDYLQLEKKFSKIDVKWNIRTSSNLDLEKTEIPVLLVHALISDILSCSLQDIKTQGEISIYFEERDQVLICTIRDNGTGRKGLSLVKNNPADYSKCLQNVQEKLDLFNAIYKPKHASFQFEIKNLQDYSGHFLGSEIRLELPIID